MATELSEFRRGSIVMYPRFDGIYIVGKIVGFSNSGNSVKVKILAQKGQKYRFWSKKKIVLVRQ